ncbi:MAG: F0F1 ATP synthase subunit A [Oscillospiraceae bacterium]|nr:F0F1 ATP synthase subunit A [Oscillospiraceae bacterium]
MNFDIIHLWRFEIGGFEIWITETHVTTWIIMGALIALAIAVRIALKNFKDVPGGFQNFIELIVETFDSFLKTNADPKLMFLGNWYFTVFAFLLLGNICGVFFLRPPSSDWAVCFAFAIVTFVLIHVMGVRYRGAGYLKSFFEPYMAKGKIPNLLLFPLNIIGELARPVSLSFRMFGNILSGTILLGLLYGIAPVFIRVLFPVPLHMYFDLFSGILQAFIFTVLSLAFISAAAETE